MTDDSNPEDILIENSIFPHYFKDPLETPHYKRFYGFGKKESNVIVLPGFENIPLTLNPECSYLHDYRKLHRKVTDQKADPLQWYRKVLENDLWFVAYFILRIKKANHPFVVARANEIQRGEEMDVVDLYARDHFKDIDVDELVPTPSGWKRHGDLKVGDFVFGSNGEPTEVVGVSEVFTKNDCYRVKFYDGYEVTCGAGHLWTVGIRNNKRDAHIKRVSREYKTKTTLEIFKHNHKQDNRYSVRLTQPLKHSEKRLLIHPYVLGVWLGDGCTAGSRITCDDPEIMEKVSCSGYKIEKRPAKFMYSVYGLQTDLKAIGVFKNKHIPDIYLRGSVEQRFELLRGLMDTDGTCDKQATATFCNINEKLAYGVFELAGSLGLAPRIRKHKTKYKGEDYYFYQVSFQSYTINPVFSLKRKLDKARLAERLYKDKYITGVEKVSTIPTNCIKVKAADGLYVIGKNYTLTHNTTLLSTCKPIQKILKNPEERICIFSFKRDAALKIYLPIKEEFEKNSMLHSMYPEILFKNPNDYDLWTRDQGFKVIRKGSFREPTLMWSALQEGMPTGMHFTGKIYDDIMTADMATSFSEMEDVKQKFDMSQNLTDNDTGMDSVNWQVIAGTPYHYLDIFEHLKGIKNHDGSVAYKFRKYPATHNGKEDGVPVLLTQTALDKLKRNKATFRTQQLLDPMPDDQRKLNGDWLIEIPRDKLPEQLYKFLLVDPAGDEQNMKTRGKGDRWAIALLGVEPVIDDIGQSNIYILDLFLRRATLAEAIAAICKMYLLAGRVVKLGVEKVGTSTYEIHIANALKKFNVFMTRENERLVLLRPGMRNKVERIQSAMEWPLQNGKWHYVDKCPEQDIKDLKAEMNTFPLGMDDGLDICSYLNDMTKDYKFPKNEATQSSGFTKPNDMWLDDDEVGRIDSRTMRAWLVG